MKTRGKRPDMAHASGMLFANPLAWLAALLIDRVLKFAWSKLTAWANALAVELKLKKENGKDQENADAYKQTLKDGVSEQAQIDASLSVLNDRDPKPKP